MGMRMEYNESHLKLLKDTLVQYDEGQRIKSWAI